MLSFFIFVNINANIMAWDSVYKFRIKSVLKISTTTSFTLAPGSFQELALSRFPLM